MIFTLMIPMNEYSVLQDLAKNNGKNSWDSVTIVSEILEIKTHRETERGRINF